MPGLGINLPRRMFADIVGYYIMKTFLKTFLRDESGASAAEYALILVVIGIAIVAGGFTLATSIGQAMSDTATCIDTPNTTNCQ